MYASKHLHSDYHIRLVCRALPLALEYLSECSKIDAMLLRLSDLACEILST
jgi:hypothetical protein